MTKKIELIGATDETIEDAVKFADPMVLRGLLYQLTGDDSLMAIDVAIGRGRFAEVKTVSDPASLALIRSKAAAFLRRYRDEGAGPIDIGPRERLAQSMSLTTGDDLPTNELDMWIEELALDPWARGLSWSQTPGSDQLNEFSVVVIGAGMGGLNAAVQLKNAGISFRVIEKNGGVGGTWYENRYPGARVDSPSRNYTHIYGVDFPYPNPYCAQDENEKYFNWVADNFDVRDYIEFHTEVKSLIWDESTSTWEITTAGPAGTRTWKANAVISCVGFLARPNVPSIDGADAFNGPLFHSARWPDNLTTAGKRIAVIGTGCTGYQMVPELAKSAAHVYAFQRTPNWVFDVAGYLDPFPPAMNWLDRNLPYHTNFVRFRTAWIAGPQVFAPLWDVDPEFSDPFAVSALNKRSRDARLEFMRSKFVDRPDMFQKMLPVAPPFSSRPVAADSNYSIYDALLRDNVTLVADPISGITRDGIVVSDGTSYDVDIIVFATGFKANDFLWPMEVRGRDGISTDELWEPDGARAYLGAMLPGFPNFFMVYGPNTNPTGGLQVVDMEEMVTRFVLQCIGHLITSGKKSVDVTPDAYWRYNQELDRAESLKIYRDPRVHNYYTNEYGRSAANMPLDVRLTWNWLRNPAGGQATATAAPPESLADVADRIRPYFGADLVVE